MSGTIDTPHLRDMNKPEGNVIRQRRPGLPKPRPISSPGAFPKPSDSFRHRPLSAAVADCEDEDGSSDGSAHQTSTANTSSTLGSIITPSNANSLPEAKKDLSTTAEVALIPKETIVDQGTVREKRELRARKLPRVAQRPNSMSLSESESIVTQDPNRYSPRGTNQFKPRRRGAQVSPSTSLSTPSTVPNDMFSEGRAEPRPDSSWSQEYPEYTIASHPPLPLSPSFDPRFAGPHPMPQPFPAHHYGAPETPRGPAPFPFFQVPPQPNPMAPAPSHISHPRIEQPPLSGYELVAAKLTGDVGGPLVKPIYRRFDAINHRVLLSLQDQIIALEETLCEIDATDSGNRQEAGLPACEREERDSNHPFHVRKGTVLGLLSQKLHNYNALLASFKAIQGLPPPTTGDIQNYKAFLSVERPIVEMETEFLNAPDLIALEPRQAREERVPNDQAPRPVSNRNRWSITQRAFLNRGPLQELGIAMIAGTFGPLVTFPVIRDFAGRMTIVVLFGVIIGVILLRSGMFNPLSRTQDAQDFLLSAGVYVGGMSVLAWVLR